MATTVLLKLFFFQAEDGIRDKLVTGVQTCGLPISHPVQGPFTEPAYPRRLEHHGRGTGRVRRSAAAHETGERSVVSGHGRRGVPEHLLDRFGAAQTRAHSLRRSHLQDEL